jgi:hypothetical protein
MTDPYGLPVARRLLETSALVMGVVAIFQDVPVLALAPLLGIAVNVDQIAALAGLPSLLASAMSAPGLLLADRQGTMDGFHHLVNFLRLPMPFLSGASSRHAKCHCGWI